MDTIIDWITEETGMITNHTTTDQIDWISLSFWILRL